MNEVGEYPPITDQECLARKHQQDTKWSEDGYWEEKLKNS